MNHLLRWVGAGALGLAVLVASAYVHLATPLGRRTAAGLVSSLVSEAIAGELRIEGVRTLWLPHVEADAVIVRVGGVEPMHLRDARVRLDVFASLYHRAPIFDEASVHGGRLDLTLSPSGEPWIERAFASADAGSGGAPPSQPGRPEMRIDGLSFEGVRFEFTDDGWWARLDRTSGRGRMWLDEGEDYQARFWSVSGRLRTSVDVIEPMTVRGFAVSVDPPGASVVSFAGRTRLQGAPVTLAGHAPHVEGSPVRLCLWTRGDANALLTGVGVEALLELFTGASLEVSSGDAPAEPSCRGGASK